jgi:hypothetical protein
MNLSNPARGEVVSASTDQIARGTECGIGADLRPMHLARKGEPVDQLNRPLDGDQLLIFQVRPVLLGIHGELESSVRRIKAIARTRAGRHVPYRQIVVDISNAQRAIRFAAPFAVCPSCAGSGLFDSKGRQRCPTCSGAGFISEGGYELLNADMKRIAEGYRDDMAFDE